VSCENLVSSCLVASACSHGVFLRKQVLKSGEAIVGALEAQLKCAVQRLEQGARASDKVKKQLVVLTGQVASACNQLKRIPKSNKGYLKRMILEAYKQSLDIANEQKEMIEDSEESPRVDDMEEGGGGGALAGSAGGGDDPFGDDFLDYDFSLSASEIVRSRKCLVLMTHGSEFLKAIAKAVGSGMKTDACSPDAVAAVDNGCFAATHFGTALNELGVSLCPPQMNANVQSSTEELLTSAGALGDALTAMLTSTTAEEKSIVATSVPTPLQNVATGLAKLRLAAAEIHLLS